MAICALGAACSQDKGNYDYVDLAEPEVSGIQDMSVLTFSQLRIEPDIQGGSFPESEYSFQWKVLDNVELKDLRNKPTTLPYYGEKHLLIFYVDPDKHKQNDAFACEIEENKYCESDKIVGFGILNLKDTVFPNSIVKMIARKRTEKNNATIIADTDNIVEQQWGLGECNNWFVIMFVTKDGEMVFCRKGEFTEQDKKDFYATIDKYR